MAVSANWQTSWPPETGGGAGQVIANAIVRDFSLQLGQVVLVKTLQVGKTTHGLAVVAAAAQGREGGPFRGQASRQAAGETAPIGQVEGPAALDEQQGGLVLLLRAEGLQAE